MPQSKARIVKAASYKTVFAMYRAIAKYIKEMGGSALVMGGVSIGRKSALPHYRYFIQVEITGRNPLSLPAPRRPARKAKSK